MAVSITLDITKTNVGPAQYDMSLNISAATNIDTNLFVLDIPSLVFQQIATPFAIDNYPVYDTQNPPIVGTEYVRTDTVTLSFADPDDAVEALADAKAHLDQLAIDWNTKITDFTGTEQYIATTT